MGTISIKIQDTTQRTTDTSDTDALFKTANGGNLISLNVNSISFSAGEGLDNSPYTSGVSGSGSGNEVFLRPEVHAASASGPKWNIKGVLDMTNATDRNIIGYFDTLTVSKGVKKLLTEDDTDNRTLVYFIRETAGDINTETISTVDYRFIWVRIDSITISNSASNPNTVNWSMTLLETPKT